MFTRRRLVEQLSALGVPEGGVVMVHASLRRVGPVEGRADGLLDAIVEVLGEHGTLLMVLGADADEPFNAATTPVDVEDMGVLAEVFRNRDGVCVNDHAAGRFAALGPGAATLIDDPRLFDYHGPGSVLDRFTTARGHVLRLGADADTVTLTHWAEYLADIPNKSRVRRKYVRADIGVQWIEGLDDNEGVKTWSGGDYFSQILLDFIQDGQARRGPVGGCTAELFEAGSFVDFAVRWMERHLA